MRKFKMKDLNIILNSNEINKEKRIKKFLEENGTKYISTDKISDLDPYAKEFLEKYGGTLLENARSEFKFTEEVKHGNDPYECQLCGKKGIIKLYQIKNEYNNNEFWVGSTCIEAFGFNNHKEVVKIALVKVFDKALPNYQSISTVPNYPIIIPAVYLDKLNIHISQIREQKNDFIKEKNVKMKDIQATAANILKLKEDIKRYISENKNEDWVVSAKVLEWFKKKPENERNILNETIENLKKRGFYEKDNFYLITEPDHFDFVRQRFISLALKSSSTLKYSLNKRRILISKMIKGSKINYSLIEKKAFSDYRYSIYNGNPIKIDENFFSYTEIIKSSDNLLKYFNRMDQDNKIESFSINNNFILYTDISSEDKIYKLDLDSVTANMGNNLYEYIKKMHTRANFYTKKRFNADIKELEGFSNRTICNRIKGIRYNNT